MKINDVWLCDAIGKKIAVRCLSILTAYEVRQYAAKKLGADPAGLDCQRISEAVIAPPESAPEKVPDWRDLSRPAPSLAAVPVIEVQWVGSDYSHGGTPDGRRLQERALGAEEWVDA